MFATFFEWEIRPGCEAEFARLWALETEALRRCGSLGSALFLNAAGHYCAIARWPSRDMRDKAFALKLDADITASLRDCTSRTISCIDMDLIDDQWVAP